MKITINGSGEESPDWPEIEYTLMAETERFKTTISYWGYAEEFKEFAQSIPKFPFENRKDLQYQVGGRKNSAYYVSLTVR